MRNGNYIRALGRIPFAPIESEEDSNSTANNPESPTQSSPEETDGRSVATNLGTTVSTQQSSTNALRSELINAQNDVLATVGVYLRDNGSKPREDDTDKVMRENEVGLIVGAVDLTLTYLSSWPLVGIRNRLQVCTIPSSL